jgi:hypothetical protein
MKTSFVATMVLSGCIALSGTSTSPAQQSATQFQPGQQATPQQGGSTTTAQQAVVKKVGFRMTNWQTIHSDGTPATQERIATLQKIGCEVNHDNHGGHVDIAFRCPTWKSIPVQNDDQLQQWHTWLVNNEFETVVLNPPTTSPLPAVKIRLADWKTMHVNNAQEAQGLKETFELIGCEVAIDNHGDHIDAKVRCPNWTKIGLVNSNSAHVWQDWLNKSGFETQHDHAADGADAHAGHNHAATKAAAGVDPHAGHNHAAGGHEGHDH